MERIVQYLVRRIPCCGRWQFIYRPLFGAASALGRSSLIESTPDLVLASGRMNAVELQAHMTALAKHLADPDTTLIDRLVVQAWGTKPI